MWASVEDCNDTGNIGSTRSIGNIRSIGSTKIIRCIGNVRSTGNVSNIRSIGNVGHIRGNRSTGNIGDRGSITVEASIIVPLVILAIAAAIYIGLLLYQRALVQSAAETAAEAGAAAWVSGTYELRTGKPMDGSFEDFALYRRIFDGDKESRLDSIEQYALTAAGRHELVRAVNSSADAVVKDYAVYRKIEVTIHKEYELPLGKFLKMFGGNDTIDMTVKAVSAIDEPVELIRNTDFIIDIERKLENRFPQLKDMGNKTRNAMNEIKEKLEQFVD